jgi:hypothetical protein
LIWLWISMCHPHSVKHSGVRLGVAMSDRWHVLAAGAVLPRWLGVVSGIIAGCDRCAAAGGAEGAGR